MRRRALLLALLVPLACGEAEPGPAAGLVDPGFEEGGEAWAYLGDYRLPLFEVSDRIAHAGARSGRLPLDSAGAPAAMPTRGATAAQEIRPAAFPERLSGVYRVEHWQRPADAMGLEVRVVIHAYGDPRTPEIVLRGASAAGPVPAGLEGFGLVWRLAGRPALEEIAPGASPWANLDFVDVDTAEPPQGTWQRFDLPVRADFERVWGTVPQDFDHLRILLQVLWTGREPGAEVRADVYFDDLALGG